MDGIIIINKQAGCTSHDIVYKVKKISNEKVGHTGTLDPLAEGVLPILIGKGTLCSKYLINHDKKYFVKLQLGIKTETADKEGKIVETQNVDKNILNKENVINILNSFIGKQEQIPPIYSAIKVNGKKLYEYARNGKNVEIKPRVVEIYDIKLQDIDKEKNQINFTVHCGKGTYIRSLCEDIATKLGTIGYMEYLQRTEVGKFKIENSIKIEQLENDKKFLEKNIIPIEKIFENKKIIKLSDKQLKMFLNGVKIFQEFPDDVYRIYNNDKFIGTGIVNEKNLKRDIIL